MEVKLNSIQKYRPFVKTRQNSIQKVCIFGHHFLFLFVFVKNISLVLKENYFRAVYFMWYTLGLVFGYISCIGYQAKIIGTTTGIRERSGDRAKFGGFLEKRVGENWVGAGLALPCLVFSSFLFFSAFSCLVFSCLVLSPLV